MSSYTLRLPIHRALPCGCSQIFTLMGFSPVLNMIHLGPNSKDSVQSTDISAQCGEFLINSRPCHRKRGASRVVIVIGNNSPDKQLGKTS